MIEGLEEVRLSLNGVSCAGIVGRYWVTNASSIFDALGVDRIEYARVAYGYLPKRLSPCDFPEYSDGDYQALSRLFAKMRRDGVEVLIYQRWDNLVKTLRSC